MTLYAGEDWFFQIDSHMSFDTGWDETLVGWAERLSAGRTGVAISAYPNPFVLENGEPCISMWRPRCCRMWSSPAHASRKATRC